MPKAKVEAKSAEKAEKPEKVAKAPKAEKAEKEVKPKAEKVPKEKKEKVVKEKKEKVVKEKKEKKVKDPNAPKRGLGSYMYFCAENRAEIKKGVEGGAPDVAKACGAAWKELTDAEKEPYNAMAAKDKIRYTKEAAAYKANPGKPVAKAAEEEGDEEEGASEEEEAEDDE